MYCCYKSSLKICLTFHRRSLVARWNNHPHARASAVGEVLWAVLLADHLHECAAFPLRCLHGPVPHRIDG